MGFHLRLQERSHVVEKIEDEKENVMILEQCFSIFCRACDNSSVLYSTVHFRPRRELSCRIMARNIMARFFLPQPCGQAFSVVDRSHVVFNSSHQIHFWLRSEAPDGDIIIP